MSQIKKGDTVKVQLNNKYPEKATYKAEVLKVPPFQRKKYRNTETENRYKLEIQNPDGHNQVYYAEKQKIKLD